MSPLNSMFEMQRQFIEQTRRASERTVEFQRRTNRQAVGMLDAVEPMQRQGLELARTATHAAFTASRTGADANTDESDTQFQRRIDEAFDDLERSQVALTEAVRRNAEAGAELYDGLADAYVETVADGATAMRDTTEHARAQVTVEGHSELPNRIEGITPGVAGRLADAGIETVVHLSEANAELVAEVAETSEAQADEWVQQAGELGTDLTELEPFDTDAVERLAEAGIETETQLAEASADTVAEVAEIPADEASRAIDRAGR